MLEAGFDRANELSSRRIAALLGGDPDHAPARTALTVVLTELIPHDAFSWTHVRVRQSFIAQGFDDARIAVRLGDDYTRLHERLGALVRREREQADIRWPVQPVTAAARLVAHAEGLANHVLLRAAAPEEARAAVIASIEELFS